MDWDIPETIYRITELSRRSASDMVWTDMCPWVVDAIRGSVLETGWRGTLTEYFNDNPLAWRHMCVRAGARLTTLEDVEWPIWPVGESNLNLGLVGLGTYGWKYDPAIIHRAVELGIGVIDTAETYGYGRVETALGAALQDVDELPVIATKASRSHLSYRSVMNAAARSIDRLKISSIDVYQVHKPNPQYPIKGTMMAMDELLRVGKVENVGVCNFSIDQIVAAQQALFPNRLDTIQVRYNLLDRGIERALLPFCHNAGMTIIAYSPLCQKFPRLLKSTGAGVLMNMAERYGVTVAQIVLAWIMTSDVVPIPRTNNMSHVDEITDSAYIELELEDIELLDDAFPIME